MKEITVKVKVKSEVKIKVRRPDLHRIAFCRTNFDGESGNRNTFLNGK
jgi:hypothetical protein